MAEETKNFEEAGSEQLDSLLKVYSEANHIYVFGFESSGRSFTAFPGTADEKALMKRYFPPEAAMALINSFSDSSVEEVIEGESEQPFLKVRAVAVRKNDETHAVLFVFVLLGVEAEILSTDEERSQVPSCLRVTTAAAFDSSVTLFRTLSDYYFRQKFLSVSLSNRLKETTETGDRLSALLKKNETMTGILKSLETEGDFVKISDDIMEEAGQYLSASNAFLLRLSPDGDTCDMISEWSSGDSKPFIREFATVPVSTFPFLTDRPYTVSSDSVLPPDFRKFFEENGISAGVFLPLKINGSTGMYLCFTVSGKERRWSVEDLRFTDDVRRVLSTILMKRITKNSLASSYAALDAILENAGCGITVCDCKSRNFLYANGTFNDMFEDAKDRTAVEDTLAERASSELSGDIPDYYAENTGRFYHITFSNIRWVDGREVSMSTFNDITDLKNYQKKIEDQANTDYLTGLSNRMRFERDFGRALKDAVRSGDNGCLLYMDLDDFRSINDGLGHHIGDFLLKSVSDSLSVMCGKKASCYRLGGDEFAVIIPARYHEACEQLISMIRKRFEQPWQLGSGEYYCTVCMGVVCFPKDGTRTETLIQRADLSLRMAKQKGRNMIERYSYDTPELLTGRLELEKAMRDAVDRGCQEFLVYYQPLIDVSHEGQKCCGAEALVRWKSEKLGFVYPTDFIPIAESLGLIVPIGEHVLIEACKRCRFWNDFGHPDYRVSVNLSIVQLLQKNIVETVKNALNYTGLNPKNLMLEVTESLASNDMEKMILVLKEIKALGVKLALDDFGTGYSSLSRLRDMPMDVIKIDKSFIDDVGKDVFSDAFVKTVSDLADTIHMDVVVEGVEDNNQEQVLEDMHINIIQGYLFDKPLTEEEFEAKYVD